VSARARPTSRVSLPIRSERLRLEAPSLRRIDEYRPLLNDREVSRWLLRVPWPYRPADARSHILRARRTRRLGTDLALAIIEQASDRLVGGIGLHHVELEHRHAEIGYWLGRPFWGKGYGSEAVETLLRVCFDDLRLHRVEAGVFRGNARSQHVLEKAGFLAEGNRREAFLKRGVWQDDLLFGLLESEWRRRRSKSVRSGRAAPVP
jgi:RimJ/RimL family protein N-acetyltransferase